MRGGHGREASIVPTAADVVTAGIEAGAPASSTRAQEQTSLLTKKERRRSDRGRGCAFHMTCPGTERVFVNPVVCQLASARRHKPLSAASPLTHHWTLSWSGLPPPLPPLACASCQLPQQLPPAGWPKQSCAGSDRRGRKEGCENQGPGWAHAAPSVLVPVTAVDVSLIIRKTGITAMATPTG